MRFYGFCNYYLSGLQQALQSAHVISDLAVKYPATSKENQTYREWAKNHKTIILLNGGNSADLEYINEQLTNFRKRGMPLPFTKFHEDEQSLNQALTAVGVVVPEKYYSVSPVYRALKNSGKQIDEIQKILSIDFSFKKWETEFVTLIGSYNLANS